MTAPKTYPLKREFRDPARQAGFVGRSHEVDYLVDLFTTRRSGTVLVAGHRGVGKSVLVGEALRVSRDRDSSLIEVRIALPDLDVESESGTIRDQVLRSLGRGLHFAIKDSTFINADAKDAAEEIYKKTYLKELEESGVLGTISQAEASYRTSTDRDVRMSASKALTLAGSALVGGGLTIAGIRLISDIGTAHGVWWSALAATSLVVGAYLGGHRLIGRVTRERSTRSMITERVESNKTGRFDVSSDTLEFELASLLSRLSTGGTRTVFVVDELDKIEALAGANETVREQDVIFRIAAGLKNFFSLSGAVFVFIAGESFYRKHYVSGRDDMFPVGHTLFTDTLLVHFLAYNDVEELLDSIFVEPPTEDAFYRKLRNYLCWESRGHVFDLLSRIGRMTVFTDEQPVLEVREAGFDGSTWRTGNLPSDWQTAAALQKFVGAAYDESRRLISEDQSFNQALWMTLQSHAHDLLRVGTAMHPQNGPIPPSGSWVEGLTGSDCEDIAGAVDGMFVRMERYGVVGVSEVTGEFETAAGEEELDAFEYALNPAFDYPSSDIGAVAVPTRVESSLVKFADRIDVLLSGIEHESRASYLPGESFNSLRSVRTLRTQINSEKSPKRPTRTDVVAGLNRAAEIATHIIATVIVGDTESWAEEVGFETTIDLESVDPATGAAWATTMTEFGDVTTQLKDSEAEFVLVGTTSTENQILVLVDPTAEQVEAISHAYADTLAGKKGRDRRIQRLPVMCVVVDGGKELPDVPTEIVEDHASTILTRFTASWGTERRTSRKDLAGWSHVVLEPDLSNRKEVGETLTRVSFLDTSKADDT